MRMLMGLAGTVLAGLVGLGAANVPAIWARTNET